MVDPAALYRPDMRFERSIEIDAAPEHVFAVYADVERWPEWAPSVTSVQRLDAGPFRVGSRARVRQPRLPVAVWEVTELAPDRWFTWVARGPGVRTVGTHSVVVADEGGRPVTATASLEQTGPLGWVIGMLTRRLTDRYLDLEVKGLKARCEAPPRP